MNTVPESLNAGQVIVTIIDVNGVVYNSGWYIAIASKYLEVEKPYVPSPDTDFEITGVSAVDEANPESKKSLDDFVIGSSYDSYYKNGFQTVLILDEGKAVTSANLYPSFETDNSKQ